LSKAFSGELVPTEAELARAEGRTFETAEELLRRAAGSAASDQKPKVARRVKKAASA
jgi:type I restriction enzyme S subunit